MNKRLVISHKYWQAGCNDTSIGRQAHGDGGVTVRRSCDNRAMTVQRYLYNSLKNSDDFFLSKGE